MKSRYWTIFGKFIGYSIITVGLLSYLLSILQSGVYQVRGFDGFFFFVGFSVPFALIILVGWAILNGSKKKKFKLFLPEKEKDL